MKRPEKSSGRLRAILIGRRRANPASPAGYERSLCSSLCVIFHRRFLPLASTPLFVEDRRSGPERTMFAALRVQTTALTVRSRRATGRGTASSVNRRGRRPVLHRVGARADPSSEGATSFEGDVGERRHRPTEDDGSTRRSTAWGTSRRTVMGGVVAATILPAPFAPMNAVAHAAEAEAEVTSRVFFDFAIDGQPMGRVVVGVFGDANPIAAARFKALAGGVQGLGYRRTEVNAVEYSEDGGVDTPLFIGTSGVRAFVIPGSTTPVEGLPGGNSADALFPELAKQTLSHTRAGLVSIVVDRGAPPPPPKERLVSMNGKFVTVADPPPPGPNGTAFVVTSGAAGAAEILDRTNLVVGAVLEGQDVVDAIAALPTVKDNSASPFFAVAKSIGDKRATVAEQAFGKPFAKVTIAKSGVVQDAPPPAPPAESTE